MNEQQTSRLSNNVRNVKQPMQDKALRHLADSIYKQLQNEGCHAKDIIGVSSQLLSLVTTDLSGQKKDS